MKKINNKGFTLVELLAVLIIMIAIMAIAIPAITPALNRSKDKQNAQKIRLIESAAELYVSEHKNKITGNCISVDKLVSEGYIDEEAAKDADDHRFTGSVSVTNGYKYSESNVNCEGN